MGIRNMYGLSQGGDPLGGGMPPGVTHGDPWNMGRGRYNVQDRTQGMLTPGPRGDRIASTAGKVGYGVGGTPQSALDPLMSGMGGPAMGGMESMGGALGGVGGYAPGMEGAGGGALGGIGGGGSPALMGGMGGVGNTMGGFPMPSEGWGVNNSNDAGFNGFWKGGPQQMPAMQQPIGNMGAAGVTNPINPTARTGSLNSMFGGRWGQY